MEWMKENTKTGVDTAKEGTDYVTSVSPVQQVTETAGAAYQSSADYIPSTGDTSSLTASLLQSEPFKSFKPDPSNVWKGYLIYVLLAAGCTIPWWTFVIAADHFNFRYPDLHLLRIVPLVYFAAWLVTYVLFCSFGRQYTTWVRINLGLIISLVAVLAIMVMDAFFIEGDHGTRTTFWLTLVAVALAGAGDSIAHGSLLGIISELPERLTHAYALGASLSGALMLIVHVITKEFLNSSPTGWRIGAIIYFSIASAFIIAVLSLFAYVHHMPEMAYYRSLGLGSMDTVRLFVQDEATVGTAVAASLGIAAVAAGRSCRTQPLQYRPVISRVKLPAIAITITAVISLLIFPGYLSEDVYSSHVRSWNPLLLLGTYVVFDVIGRSVTWISAPNRNLVLFGASWARLLILPFFILAIFFQGSTMTAIIFSTTAVLGATNGYLITCLIMLIPRNNPPDQVETAVIIMTTLMTVGILVGAGLSWLLI